MKRSPLRRISKKRAAQERESRPAMDEFKAEHPACWCCRAKPTNDVHHILRGAFKAKTYGDRRGWYAACRDCHTKYLGDYRKVPLVVQLATKRLRDPEWFDLRWVNEMRGRVDDAITLEELEIN